MRAVKPTKLLINTPKCAMDDMPTLQIQGTAIYKPQKRLKLTEHNTASNCKSVYLHIKSDVTEAELFAVNKATENKDPTNKIKKTPKLMDSVLKPIPTLTIDDDTMEEEPNSTPKSEQDAVESIKKASKLTDAKIAVAFV